MRRLPISVRLTLSFAIILLLSLIGSVVGVWQFLQVQEQAQRLNQINAEAIAILRVHNSVLNLKDELQDLTAREDAARFSREAAGLSDTLTEAVEEAMRALLSSPVKNQESRYTVQLRQLTDIGHLSAQVELMAALAEAGDWPGVRSRLENQVQPASQITQNLVAEIDRVVASERKLAMQNMEQTQRQALAAMIGAGLLILTTAGLLGWIVIRSIARPLAVLGVGTRALARGEFDYRTGITGNDELAHLSRAFDNAAAQLAELYTGLEEMVRQRTEELHYRAVQLETSFAVGQRVTSILELSSLLPQVAALIREGYGYSHVGIFLRDESGTSVILQAGAGEDGVGMFQLGRRLELDPAHLIGWVVQNCQPARIDDVSLDDRCLRLDPAQTGSELALPLLMGGAVLGVLDFRSRQEGAFREKDLPALESLANQVTIAIQNASLYQSEQSRRQMAEVLNDAGRAISSTLDLKEVLNLILEYLVRLVSYDRAGVMLQNDDIMEIVAARGFPTSIDPLELRIPISQDDVFQEIARTRRPLIIPDVLERPDWQQVNGLPLARAWLGVPLIRPGRVIGMLSLTREAPDAYSKEEATMAATFAGQAAIALENARLYDEIVRFSQQLEGLVEKRTGELQLAYSQLAHLDQNKSDFINIAAHELRTPITILRGYSHMLLGDPKIKRSPYHLDLIAGMHSGAIRLTEVVNSMLDMAKIDSRALELYPEPVSVPSLLELVCQKFAAPLAQRKLTLIREEMSDLPPIEADPDAFDKVFYHLISNAIKYTPDGGTIMISGAVKNGEGTEPGVEIVVSDTGIGIDPEYQSLIFAKFYQTGKLSLHSTGKTKFKGAGPGLGLAIVRGIVEAHRGRAWVESPGYDEATCPGSHFHVFFPLRQGDLPDLYRAG